MAMGFSHWHKVRNGGNQNIALWFDKIQYMRKHYIAYRLSFILGKERHHGHFNFWWSDRLD